MNLKNPIVQGVSPSQNAIVQKKIYFICHYPNNL